MKKKFALILSLVIMLSVFSVCGIITDAEENEEPVFNSEGCIEFPISSYGNGVFSNEKLTVHSGTDSYFVTSMESDSIYYLTMTVKSDDKVNIGWREDQYLNLQAAGFEAVGITNSGWTDKQTELVTGARVTVYSTPSSVTVWLNGEKIIDSVSANANMKPGITWSFGSTVECENIKIWQITDEPVFNAEKDQLYRIKNYGNGVFADGKLIVPSGTDSYFVTSMESDASYYLTMTVKTDNMVNIGWREGQYLNLQSGGFEAVGITNAGWTSKQTGLSSGTRVTVYSTPSSVTIWLNGDKIIDSELSNANVKTGITWSFDSIIEVENVKIWTNEKLDMGEEYDAFTDSKYVSLIGEKAIIPEGSYGAEDNVYFSRTLKQDVEYYTSFTLKSTSVDTAISFVFRTGQYIQITPNGFTCPGTGIEDWNNKIDLTNGVDVKIYTTMTHVKIWIDGKVVVDADYTDQCGFFGAEPYVCWVKSGEAEFSDIKVWTENTLGDCDEDGEITVSDMVVLRIALLDVTEIIQIENADVDADGEMTIRDFIRFKKYFASERAFG